MASITPDPSKRDCSLPAGCSDLMDVLKLSAEPQSVPPANRINGQIRAPMVLVQDEAGKGHGLMPLADAISLASASGIDLVEVDSTTSPPLCVLINYGRYRYQQLVKAK
jgi:translation initiation factor IF-3